MYYILKELKVERQLTCPYCGYLRLYDITSFEKKDKDYFIECYECKKKFKFRKGYKKIYLSRTLSAADVAFKYPVHIYDHYSGLLEIIDPLNWQINVDDDIKHLKECDIFVGLVMGVPTFGTILEMSYAHRNNIPVYFINPTRQWLQDPWVKYHSTRIFDDVDKCYEEIIISAIKELNNM